MIFGAFRISSESELRSEKFKSPFPKCHNSTFRENREKLWLKITLTSFPHSLPTICEGLSPLETQSLRIRRDPC